MLRRAAEDIMPDALFSLEGSNGGISDEGIGGRPRGGGIDQRQRDLRKAKVLLVDDQMRRD